MYNTKITTIVGDITKVTGMDAIVNAASPTLIDGGTVNNAVFKAAGEGLFHECKNLGGCQIGESKITKGYELPNPFIMHTVGPIWNGGTTNEVDLLASCYRSSLDIAMKHGIKRIAFPSIATGIYHFPVALAAETAAVTVREILNKNDGLIDEICWVLFDNRTKLVYDTVFKNIFNLI